MDKVETIVRSSCAVMVYLVLMGLLAAQTAWAEWMEQDKITASDAAAKVNFGNSVSISGDYALVAAYTDDHSGKDDPGSAYIYINAPPGDADLNSDVDGSDLATLAMNYGSGQPTPECE